MKTRVRSHVKCDVDFPSLYWRLRLIGDLPGRTLRDLTAGTSRRIRRSITTRMCASPTSLRPTPAMQGEQLPMTAKLLMGLWDGLGVQQSARYQVEDREKDLECEVRPSVQMDAVLITRILCVVFWLPVADDTRYSRTCAIVLLTKLKFVSFESAFELNAKSCDMPSSGNICGATDVSGRQFEVSQRQRWHHSSTHHQRTTLVSMSCRPSHFFLWFSVEIVISR